MLSLTTGAGSTISSELEDDDHLYASIEDVSVTDSLTRSESFKTQQEILGHFHSTILPTASPGSQAGTGNNSYTSISHQRWAINWPDELATGSSHASSDHEQPLWASFEVSIIGRLKS